MGLGSVDLVTLAEARHAAQDARKLIRAGVDPLDAKRAQRATARAASDNTFRAIAGLYLSAHEHTWRNPKHRAQWRSTLDTYIYPRLGNRPVASIATGDVMAVLEPIWRSIPETASRVRGRIESVLDYATARGWRSGDNPARWRGHLQNLLPARAKVATVEHHPALPWREAPAFMAELAQRPAASARALAFTILTAARTSEALGAPWREVDLAERVWTIPPERMKANREHRVPLSDAAIAILEAVKPKGRINPDALIFTGDEGQPLSDMALLMLLRRMKRRDITTHGFRSTFRDWAGETTSHPREIAEAALAHTLKDKTEAAYRRGDALEKRRALMRDWADFLIPA